MGVNVTVEILDFPQEDSRCGIFSTSLPLLNFFRAFRFVAIDHGGPLIDGGFLDGVIFAGAVGKLQRLQPEKKIKAIITNHNLGSVRAGINFLGFFETKWNAGVQPGEYYWPFDPDLPSDILINTVPQRSYQIFSNELVNETSLADMKEGIPGDDINITTALFEDVTTIDNPAYDIR